MDSALCFSGFGGSKVKPLGCFKDAILINGECFHVTICVVADGVMTMEAVVGNELLSQAEIKINQEGFTINKISEINSILSANYSIESNTPAIGLPLMKKREKKYRRFWIIMCLRRLRKLTSK